MADAASAIETTGRAHLQTQNSTDLFIRTLTSPLVLLLLICGLYGFSLTNDFILDDYQFLEVMSDYAAGQRDDIHFYQFINGGTDNAVARRDGSFAWWLGDDVKYRHWRPLAEYVLYGQFKLFGHHPLGYRVVSLLVYWLGCCLSLRLFRYLTPTESSSRWATLFFLFHTTHAIPVSFISSQADVIALVLVFGSLLLWLTVAEELAEWRSLKVLAPAIFGTLLYGLALGFKESVLPVSTLPFWIVCCQRERFNRKLMLLGSAVLCMTGLIWLYFYSQGGYGSNTAVMLDPIRRTGEYLVGLPTRTLVLLSALAIPLNPFLFYFRPHTQIGLYIFSAVGALVLIIALRHVSRIVPKKFLLMYLGWVLIFMPLLVCTVPDDRILMFPSIGFAALLGTWRVMVDDRKMQKIGLAAYIGLHAIVAFSVTVVFSQLDRQIEHNFRTMVNHIGDLQPGDKIYLVNSRLDVQVLFGQQTLHALIGRDDIGFAYLSDSEYPKVERAGLRSLRVVDESGFFNSFLGAMGTSRAVPKKVGDSFDAGFYRVRLTKIKRNLITEILIEFDEPLESPRYHFFIGEEMGEPQPWTPPPFAN